MVAIYVLTAVLLSTAALKARAEPSAGFYDEANEVAVRELVEDLLLRELGPADYADLADREPIFKALSSVVKTGVSVAGKASKYAGKAANYIGQAGSAAQKAGDFLGGLNGGGGGGAPPVDEPLTQNDINNNKNFKNPIKFEAPKGSKPKKPRKQRKQKKQRSRKGKREFLDGEDDNEILQRDFEDLVERAWVDAVDSLEEREFDFDGEDLDAREFGEDKEELLMRDFEDASWLEDLD